MKTRDKDRHSFKQTLQNNIYVIKLGREICPSRIVHAFFKTIIDYAGWVFFSAYFMRYVVNALDTGRPARDIFLFVFVCGFVFFIGNMYWDYVSNVVVPLTDTKIYHGVYMRLYRKAKNVELRCYENADFYNKYTMAIDDAGTKVTTIIDSFWGVFLGVVGVALIFYAMFEVSPLSVLFIISPLVGNFLFGTI